MTDTTGGFIWYELLTPDAPAAEAFYADVVGWNVTGFEGGGDYRILNAGDVGVGGLMTLPDGAPMAAGWYGYLHVADTDAAVAAIEAAGGRVAMPAITMEGVGRIAMVADPQGVLIYVMQPAPREPGGTSTAFDRHGVGHCSWNELVTSDLPGATDFYTGQFGWSLDGIMPMGPMGDYQFVAHDGVQIGAMMGLPDPARTPRWNYYFRVDGLDAALARAVAAGATDVIGPHEVPGSEWVVQASDPQGVPFALVSAIK